MIEPIPNFRAVHIIPYLDYMRSIGAPVEKALHAAGLPTEIPPDNKALLPLGRSIGCVTDLCYQQGVDDIALRAKLATPLKHYSSKFLSSVLFSPSLKRALEATCSLATSENSQARLWLSYTPDCFRINYTFVLLADKPALHHHLELNAFGTLVGVIKAYAGSHWYPEKAAFSHSVAVGNFTIEHFPDTRFIDSQPVAWIELPRAMASMGPLQQTNKSQASGAASEGSVDFPTSLKYILRSYLGDDQIDIKLASELAGTSLRTLQRRLSEYGLSYSDLIQQLRYEAATEMLGDGELKIIDISQELGWPDPSHFSRAFRKYAGISPREYRKGLCAC